MHLRKGSAKPPKNENKLRLYSMKHCSFAQRVRLILLVKNIPHDIVDINILDKPEWITDINPSGKIPILDTGVSVITESVDICNYLDTIYPNPPLYSKDENETVRDKTLINEFESISSYFYDSVLMNSNMKPHNEHMKILPPMVQKYENELRNRGTLFFGGNVPHMIDYMLWPFAERASLIPQAYSKEMPGENVYPCLFKWCAAMRKLPEVQQTKSNIQRQAEIFQKIRNGDFNVDLDLDLDA